MTKKESHCKAYSDFLNLKLSNYRFIGVRRTRGNVYPVTEVKNSCKANRVIVYYYSVIASAVHCCNNKMGGR